MCILKVFALIDSLIFFFFFTNHDCMKHSLWRYPNSVCFVLFWVFVVFCCFVCLLFLLFCFVLFCFFVCLCFSLFFLKPIQWYAPWTYDGLSVASCFQTTCDTRGNPTIWQIYDLELSKNVNVKGEDTFCFRVAYVTYIVCT